MKTIFLLEDDEKLQKHLLNALNREGFLVDSATSIKDMSDHLAVDAKYDAFILDRMIQTEDSQDYIPRIRQKWPAAAILILSAINTPAERTRLLNMGADDYIGKPFSLVELIARMHALLRRMGQGVTHLSSLGNTVIDTQSRNLTVQGKLCNIPAKEFFLLRTLCQFPGRVYSRDELLDIVWGVNCDLETNVVEATITNLRRRLTELGSNLHVKNSRNLGYWVES